VGRAWAGLAQRAPGSNCWQAHSTRLGGRECSKQSSARETRVFCDSSILFGIGPKAATLQSIESVGKPWRQLLCSLVSRAGAGNLPCKAAAVSRRPTHGIDAACEDAKSMRGVWNDSTTVRRPEQRIGFWMLRFAGNEGEDRRQAALGRPTGAGKARSAGEV
jgi:hypothetical protein